MAVDAGKELRRAVDTGKVFFGKRQVEKSILDKTGKLVIASKNAEKYAKERIKELCRASKVPFYEFDANGLEIGSYCGKPFVVSFAAVLDKGKSRVLDLAKSK
jgi:large subunit ribosomal protein L30e